MNIIQIIPGSGGTFYCGNCLRDSKFVEALRKQGHSVVKIPMYLPLFSDEHDLGDTPVFYGAISIYLKQRYPIFQKAPKWMDKLLNSGPMLKFAAKMSGSTDAKGLEDMTISMLLGEEGKQKEELHRMTDWIAEHCKPDIIHISNALLLGLAHAMKERLQVPVVCSLQDEDVWVDVMKPQFRDKIWKLMADKGRDVDAFISVSQYFAKRMQPVLNISDARLHTIYLGVDPADYPFNQREADHRHIGYLSRMCHENGMDILVDAFIILKRDKKYDDVRLILSGGSTGADTGFIKENMARIKKNGLEQAVEWQEDFEGEARLNFFKKVAVISVPVRNGEAFGLYMIEAMASGVPMIQPALGAFPEIIKKTDGGVVYANNTPEELAVSLINVLDNPEALRKLSLNARTGVENHFRIDKHAAEMIEVYRNLVNTT